MYDIDMKFTLDRVAVSLMDEAAAFLRRDKVQQIA